MQQLSKTVTEFQANCFFGDLAVGSMACSLPIDGCLCYASLQVFLEHSLPLQPPWYWYPGVLHCDQGKYSYFEKLILVSEAAKNIKNSTKIKEDISPLHAGMLVNRCIGTYYYVDFFH